MSCVGFLNAHCPQCINMKGCTYHFQLRLPANLVQSLVDSWQVEISRQAQTPVDFLIVAFSNCAVTSQECFLIFLCAIMFLYLFIQGLTFKLLFSLTVIYLNRFELCLWFLALCQKSPACHSPMHMLPVEQLVYICHLGIHLIVGLGGRGFCLIVVIHENAYVVILCFFEFSCFMI